MEQNNRTSSSLAGISVILAVLGLLSKGVGFIREIIYANNFGLSAEFDIFLTASIIPIIINSAAIYLSQHYFIPVFNKIKSEGIHSSDDFFNSTFWLFVLAGIVISLILFIFTNLIFDFLMSSVAAEARTNGIQIFLIFLLTIPMHAAMSIITAYLQANFNFIFPAVIQIVFNFIIIISLMVFSDFFKIFVLPVSYLFGTLFSLLLLYMYVKSKIKMVSLNVLTVRRHFSELNALFILILIEGFSLSYSLADRYFIGNVPHGGIAALNYAFVIYMLPVTLLSIPLITTMFSKFSKSASTNSFDLLVNDFLNSSRVNLYMFIPITFLIYFWGDILLRIFYERGKFTSVDTIMTYSTLQKYTIGLVFYTSYLIAVKLLYSLNKYIFILVISITAILLKITLNFSFVKLLNQDGLALSTALVYIFLFIVTLIYISNILRIKNKTWYSNIVIYHFSNGLIAVLISLNITRLFEIQDLLVQLFQAITFIIVFIVNSYILGDMEYRAIKNTVWRLIFTTRKHLTS